MSDQPRPVWLTRAQRDLLVNPQVPGDRESVMRELISAWDAAPADPTEAACAALDGFPRATAWDSACDVLRALGMPDA